MTIPTLIALFLNETDALRGFSFTLIILFVISGGILYLLRKEKTETLGFRDGFLFVTLSWIIASLFGAFPFCFSGAIPHFADAFFETVSGFTTTGASILGNIETLPRSILFWRSLTHWLGGMGIVVLTVAILPLFGIGGLQLLKAEAPGPTQDKLSPRITQTAKNSGLSMSGLPSLKPCCSWWAA